MKLKKAKKMLKELGIDTVIIKDNDCASSNGPDVSINTGEPHKLDDATVVSTTLGYDDFEITYEKPSSKKEKKKKKKAKRKSAYDNEIARIQRNFRHYKTGEGQYEPSEEEKEKMEDQRQEQNTKQRKYPPKGNPVNKFQNRHYGLLFTGPSTPLHGIARYPPEYPFGTKQTAAPPNFIHSVLIQE